MKKPNSVAYYVYSCHNAEDVCVDMVCMVRDVQYAVRSDVAYTKKLAVVYGPANAEIVKEALSVLVSPEAPSEPERGSTGPDIDLEV